MLTNVVQNLVATATLCPGFVHPCGNGTALADFRQVIVVACSEVCWCNQQVSNFS
jgi:hypothetical protein